MGSHSGLKPLETVTPQMSKVDLGKVWHPQLLNMRIVNTRTLATGDHENARGFVEGIPSGGKVTFEGTMVNSSGRMI